MRQEDKFRMLENRLRKVDRYLARTASRSGVTCYRVYDHDLPEFPFCVDRYEDKLHVAEYRRHHGMDDQTHDRWLAGSLERIGHILEVPREKIFLKERKRKSSRLDQYEKQASDNQFFTVREGGLQFRVNLSDYLDTGLFLDYRVTREMVRESAKGKRVLNLFCYTGSFSVYAAAGGALDLESVDLSNTYLDWAGENLRLNGLWNPDKQHLVRSDVIRYLPGLTSSDFDLVILDPPTFSNSKGMKKSFDIQQDHPDLVNQTLRVMRPGGIMYFSTNSTKFVLMKELIRASAITDITAITTPFDFQGKGGRKCFLIRK